MARRDTKLWIVGGLAALGVAVYLIARPKTAQAAPAPQPTPTTPQPLPPQPSSDGGLLSGILPPGFKFDRDHVIPDPFTPIPWDPNKPSGL